MGRHRDGHRVSMAVCLMKCFETPTEKTEYEKWMDLLFELTGLCHCNLCKALKINAYKENTDDDS